MSSDNDALRTTRTQIDLVADESAHVRDEDKFLRLRHVRLRNRYEDGRTSREYRYDFVVRASMDAVGLVLYAPTEGEPSICVRSALRPPLAFREGTPPGAMLWEIPAGLIEPGEDGEDGVRRRAADEALEEVGIAVDPSAFELLGSPVYCEPGVMAERIHLLAAAVDPASASAPQGDGSPVEEVAQVRFLPLSEAFEAMRRGDIADAKTEVALWRFVSRRRAQ